ncbi:ferrochelatase, partial [Xanthomonas citri pv. citri]
MSGSVAVILMAYGTPGDPSEIEAYYTDIRRGRPPTPEALADLTARYVAIGGVSPLAEITEAQRHALQRSLDEREPGRFVVSLGMKHAAPKVEAAAATAVEQGAQ